MIVIAPTLPSTFTQEIFKCQLCAERYSNDLGRISKQNRQVIALVEFTF